MENLKETLKNTTLHTGPVIKSKAAYAKIMTEIERLMAKGSKKVNVEELAKIRRLYLAAQAYERKGRGKS